MTKFLEYVLALKDKISEPLRKVAGASNAANGNVGKLKDQVNQLDTSFNKAASGGITRFNIAMGNLIASGITRLGAMISDFAAGSANGMIKREQDITGLTTFLGGEAKKVYDLIEGDAAATPFGLDSLLAANRGLISTGMNSEKARKDVLNLSNAVAAVGGSDDVLTRMGANMQQIANVGKASQMDIKQFAFAGINIYKLLSDATGKSVKQVQEMEVSYDLLSMALGKAAQKGGLYYGASERQSKTMGGLLSTLHDGFAKFMADTGEAMRPFLEKGIAYMQKFIDKTPEILKMMAPIIKFVGNLFFGLFNIIGGVIGFFQSWYQKIQAGSPVIVVLTALLIGVVAAIVLMEVWSMLASAALFVWYGAQMLLNQAMLINPIGIVIALVVAFIALIAFIIYKYSGWGEAWKNLVSYMSNSWYSFKENFNLIFLKVVDGFMSGVEAMQRAWYKFKSLWDEDGANEGLAKLNSQANDRAKEIAESKGKIAEFDKMAAESWNRIGLKDNGKGLGDFVKDAKGKLGIAAPTVGGQTVKTSFGTADAKGSKGKGKSDTVATGGTKNTTINITIGKQVETVKLYANDVKEGAAQIRDIIVDEMSRAIAMSQALAD